MDVSDARRLPQSKGNITSHSRQLETLAGEGRQCGMGEGMQGSTKYLKVSPRSRGPHGVLQCSPKGWCTTATDATAGATLLIYAIANR